MQPLLLINLFFSRPDHSNGTASQLASPTDLGVRPSNYSPNNSSFHSARDKSAYVAVCSLASS